MEVQRELSQIIRSEIKDPRIHPLTSVVAVEVTPDLKYCKAYISVLGDEEAGKATIEGLRSAASFVRRELAHTASALLWVCIVIFLLLIRIYRQLYIWRKLPQNLPI